MKKAIKLISKLLVFASAFGAIYFVAKKYLEKKGIEDANKVQYVSFNSKDDEFISEEVSA